MKTYILLTFIVGCVGIALAQDDKPWFCRNYDCPQYTTTTTTDDYDIRTYGETSWLATSVKTTTPWPTKEQKRSMFFKLFPYFSMRRNSAYKRMKMAVPALFKVEKSAENEYTVTMMFFIADSNPPTPRGKGADMVTIPATDIYVRGFKEIKWPEDAKYDENVEELKTAITDKSSFDENTYYRAAYNYPFDLRMKQHEIWYIKV